MRTKLKRRFVAIFALAGAGAVAVAGIAMGSGNSSIGLDWTPADISTSTFTSGKIFVHTHTDYTNPGNLNPGGATERAQLYFDDSFRVNTDAVPKCDPNQISGTTVTLAQAKNRCGSALVGRGTAQAIYDPPPPGGGTNPINACVRIFNGQGTASEILVFTRAKTAVPPNTAINCSTDGTQGNTSILLAGDLKANPSTQGADFADPDNCSAPQRVGCQLDFQNITNSSPFPLADFDTNVQKANFIQAKCNDTGEAQASRLDLKAKFTYNGGTPLSQTKSSSANCL